MEKTRTYKRPDASELYPKKLKPFNLRKFLRMSRKLRKAVDNEEKTQTRL